MLLTKIAKDLISSTRFMEKALNDLLFHIFEYELFVGKTYSYNIPQSKAHKL